MAFRKSKLLALIKNHALKQTIIINQGAQSHGYNTTPPLPSLYQPKE